MGNHIWKRRSLSVAKGICMIGLIGNGTYLVGSPAVIEPNGGIVVGTDCSKNSVTIRSSDLGDGYSRLLISFRGMKSALKGGVTADRANCNIRLPASLRSQSRLILKSFKADGRVALNYDSTASLSARVALFGVDTTLKTVMFDGDLMEFGAQRYARELLKVGHRSQAIVGPCMRQESKGLLQLTAVLAVQEKDVGFLRGEPFDLSDLVNSLDGEPIHEISNAEMSIARMELIYRQEACR